MTSAADRGEVLGAFDASLYPGGGPGTLRTAWLGIYQTLWWFEHGVLHIREANDLRREIWQTRAKSVEQYIADEMGIAVDELPLHVDRMMNLPRWCGKQRNNPLGHGLRIIVSELLARYGNPRFSYPEEVPAAKYFPGIQMPGRSAAAKMDVAVERPPGKPRAVISCKWAYKHDRISDPTNECVQYKSAAVQQNVMDVRMYVVTNEMSVSRLDKILSQPCVDGLVHVHLAAVARAERYSAAMRQAIAANKLMDLADFVALTHTWS